MPLQRSSFNKFLVDLKLCFSRETSVWRNLQGELSLFFCQLLLPRQAITFFDFESLTEEKHLVPKYQDITINSVLSIQQGDTLLSINL